MSRLLKLCLAICACGITSSYAEGIVTTPKLYTIDEVDCNRVPKGEMRDKCFAKQGNKPKAKLDNREVIERYVELKREIANKTADNLAELRKELANMEKEYAELIDKIHNGLASKSGYHALPKFFYNQHNKLTCKGDNGMITIHDAAQEFFDDGKTYLFIKFSVDLNVNAVPDVFLNKDIRQSFALYGTNGNEVAFYNGKPSNNDIRYHGKDKYTAEYVTNGYVLNDFSCAKRKFNRVMAPDGTYDAPKLKY